MYPKLEEREEGLEETKCLADLMSALGAIDVFFKSSDKATNVWFL